MNNKCWTHQIHYFKKSTFFNEHFFLFFFFFFKYYDKYLNMDYFLWCYHTISFLYCSYSIWYILSPIKNLLANLSCSQANQHVHLSI